MYGTKYLEAFLAGKKPDMSGDGNFESVTRWIKTRKIAMLNELATEFCKMCHKPEESEIKSINNGCFECKYKKYFDSLTNELV